MGREWMRISSASGLIAAESVKEGASYLFLHEVPELRMTREDETYIRIGSAVTFTEALSLSGLRPHMPQNIR
jgi:xanthine dehydrogenase iron-sulfur cluster and FAD-binding subunit A